MNLKINKSLSCMMITLILLCVGYVFADQNDVGIGENEGGHNTDMTEEKFALNKTGTDYALLYKDSNGNWHSVDILLEDGTSLGAGGMQGYTVFDWKSAINQLPNGDVIITPEDIAAVFMKAGELYGRQDYINAANAILNRL